MSLAAYARKLRNFFLAHSDLDALMHGPHPGTSVPYSPRTPQPVTESLSGLNQWTSVSRDYYLGELNTDQSQMEANRMTNEATVLRVRRQSELAPTEILRIKAFGLRDPDIGRVMADLAAVLSGSVLDAIRPVFDEAVNRFNYGRRTSSFDWPSSVVSLETAFTELISS